MGTELIKIGKQIIGDSATNSVDARELHGFLKSGQKFADWVNTKVVNNPFFEKNIDWIVIRSSRVNPEYQGSSGGRPRKDYALTQDTAKKVAMSEQTSRGNDARDYFLMMEKKAKRISAIPNNLSIQVKDAMEIAKSLGLKGQDAALATNKMIKKSCGIDCMELLGINEVKSEQYFTPTTIAASLGVPRTIVNQALVGAGLQISSFDQNGRLYWIVTNKGMRYSKLLKNGKTPTTHPKWSMAVVNLI